MPLQLPDDLMHSSVFPHPADKIELIETHISWVLLAGDHAYKIKKPVNFGFLDFSTREKRRAACLEELRINRRTAPMLYEALVCISDNPVEIHEDSRDPPAEYAIRMRRFAQSALLPSVLNTHPDTLSLMDDLARHVAGFHAMTDIAGTGSPYGTPDSVLAPAQQNVAQLRRQINDPALLGILATVEQWVQTTFTRLKDVFAERQTSGHVRECHGDMHLGNIVVLNGKPLLFDALEFNASLRWIDRMSDVAFLVMDLQMNAHPDLGWHFLNKWLESTGDYQGLRLLPWYLCYRAMVRAKVAALRLTQLEGDARLSALAQCRAYLELAERYTRPQPRALIINHGLSGSGKTTHSQYLVDHCGLIRIRADVERKRLFGLHAAESSQRIAGGIYTEEANLRTQVHLEQLAQTVLEAGYPVLVDATFIRREPRERMRALATALQAPWLVLVFEAAPATLRERTARRAASGHDASEATADVVASQMEHYEPLAESEQSTSLVINTDTPPDWSCLLPVFCARTRLRSVFD